jgi:cbb3-type cytochrome oxidase subunit 1
MAGIRLLRISAIYLLLGLVLGLVMGISGDFLLMSVHAHLLLLGWAAMAVTGIVYIVLPQYSGNRLASVHFWGHNLGLPVMMVGLVMQTYGHSEAEPGVAAGSILVTVSLAMFTVNLFRRPA